MYIKIITCLDHHQGWIKVQCKKLLLIHLVTFHPLLASSKSMQQNKNIITHIEIKSIIIIQLLSEAQIRKTLLKESYISNISSYRDRMSLLWEDNFT